MEMENEESRQIRACFTTKLPPPLKVPNAPIAVPSNITRMGLSEIVNLLLKNGDPDYEYQPFDFLIDGEFVRMSLEEFLVVKGISAEKVLEIEYIKAIVPRKQEEAYVHDDWVSAIDGSVPSFMVTGCYDGLGRVWKSAGLCSHILEGHSGAVTSVCVFNAKGSDKDSCFHVATGSKDRTLRLWKFDASESLTGTTKIRPFKILQGHSLAVQCLSSDPSGDMVCSGSWDCSIKIWKTNENVIEDNSVSVKKRKVDSKTAFEELQLEGDAMSTLVGHTQCISSVIWPEPDTVYSASWDHSIRRWDVESGKDSLTMLCGKALNCVDVGGESSALIAAGGSDPILRVWDPRKPGTVAPVFQFSSHSSWISACMWHPISWFHLLSASYDGKVMLWDLRTAWPLAVIDSHDDKVLCADWWKDDSIISGGADSEVHVYSGVSI